MKGNLKVSDIVKSFKKKDLESLTGSMKILNEYCQEYSDISSIKSAEELDKLKRQFVGEYQYFSEQFSKVKRYKGTSHTYLEEERKRIKAEAIQKMLDRKEASSITAAKELVYNDNFYKDRIDLIQNLIEFFIKTESMYDRYSDVLQAIKQSISVSGKEKYVG